MRSFHLKNSDLCKNIEKDSRKQKRKYWDTFKELVSSLPKYHSWFFTSLLLYPIHTTQISFLRLLCWLIVMLHFQDVLYCFSYIPHSFLTTVPIQLLPFPSSLLYNLVPQTGEFSDTCAIISFGSSKYLSTHLILWIKREETPIEKITYKLLSSFPGNIIFFLN